MVVQHNVIEQYWINSLDLTITGLVFFNNIYNIFIFLIIDTILPFFNNIYKKLSRVKLVLPKAYKLQLISKN
jgi:hypothetical protein